MNTLLQQAVPLFSALLTPTIAIIMTYVAVQQYRMAKSKRELELYDRRLAVFRNVVHIHDFIVRGNTVSHDKFIEWLNSIAEAEFLFGREVKVLLDDLSDAVGDYFIETNPEGGGGDPMAAAEIANRIAGFYGPIKDVFMPYLDLRHVGGHRRRPLTEKVVRKIIPPVPASPKKVADAAAGRGDEDVPF